VHRVGGAEIHIKNVGDSSWQYEGYCESGWFMADNVRKYVFGWPDDGGVWVLWLPFNTGETKWERDSGGWIVYQEGWRRYVGRIANTDFDELDALSHGDIFLGSLHGVKTMNEFSEMLQELGAWFCGS
jgi:hypothetical protein